MNNSTWIKNWEEIARNPERQDALKIAEAGLNAINTRSAIKNTVVLNDDVLTVHQTKINLADYESIKVIAIGKASAAASEALEEILNEKITAGVSLGITVSEKCRIIKNFKGTHPHPSTQNIKASKEIAEIAQNSSDKDLAIVIVSGGGSALLSWPESECDQGKKLYDNFLSAGATIQELNVARKHLSLLKGGGLAKLLYPSTVISLILSDIPGDEYEHVASGPTYLDSSTIHDAQKIIEKYGLGDFDLLETPKEQKYFEKVLNIPLVSNRLALEAMTQEAQNLGYNPLLLTSKMYDSQTDAIQQIFEYAKPRTVVLAGGATSLKITRSGGTGGRNMNLAMQAVTKLSESDTFVSLASDGLDNSDSAGAIVDFETLQHPETTKIQEYIEKFDCYTFLQKTNDLIFTGPTEANVSDLMFLLRK